MHSIDSVDAITSKRLEGDQEMTDILQTTGYDAGAAAAGCPFHAGRAALQPRCLDQQDELSFPMNKRVIAQYSKTADGAPELHLYYGDKEISFDEPELFPFGEKLATQARFAAGTATSWGEGYDWPRIQELLEQLLEGGILEYAGKTAPAAVFPRDGARPSPLPPAETTEARTWLECESITETLAGRPLELGYLELVIPIFRVAHMALDGDGRQVGEANVFPKPLRLDIPTKWRTCIYSGSRFQDEKPMNVTALKAIRAHWPQIMTALLRIREAYLERFPHARNGWTVGEIERLATLVLAVPTYQLMRKGGLQNGELHPALSSMFRVTDGLRMTTHQMLFVPTVEATLTADTPITSAEIYDYAERNYSFHSTHGVCAGPKVMIEEFLGVLIDGKPIGDAEAVVLDAAVEAALGDLDAAFDYGLDGLQAHAVVFSLWPAMTRTYDQLSKIVEAWSGEPSDALKQFRAHLGEKMEILKRESLHATEEWRVNRERVYAHIYEHCERGLGRPAEHSLPARIAQGMQADEALTAELRALVRERLCGATDHGAADAGRVADCLMTYFLQARATLELACNIQERINMTLGRTSPKRPFNAADVDIHILLQGNEARRLPYLINELESVLGFAVDITKDRIAMTKGTRA
jgi:hypothetical protein